MKKDCEISNWKAIDKGALRGAFSVKLASGIIIHGVLLFEKQGRRWIAFPAKKITSESGAVSWQPHVEIPDKGIAETFRSMVLAALDAM